MKNFILNKQTVTALIASLLIFLFVYTGLRKLMDIESFRLTLTSSLVLKKFSTVLTWAIPLYEIGLSGLLFLPHFRNYGFLLSATLLGLFSVYITYMLLFVPHLPCSCGGIIQQMNWPQHLVFNLVFFLLSLYGWIVTKNLNKNFIAINRTSRTPA